MSMLSVSLPAVLVGCCCYFFFIYGLLLLFLLRAKVGAASLLRFDVNNYNFNYNIINSNIHSNIHRQR